MGAFTERACGQLMQLDYKIPAIVIESPDEVPITFWERFEFSFDQSANNTFNDRLHAFNTMSWYLESGNGVADRLGDRTARVASRALSRSAVSGIREAAFDLPIAIWLKEQRNFLADVLLYALDTEDEDAVTPLDPSYRVLERSWWKRLSESRGFCYGIRPFQASPYAFVSAGIWSGDSLLALAHVRYHYRRFSAHQFEIAVSLPLSHGLSLDLGAAHEFGGRVEEKKLVLKLSKQLRGGGIVHVGMEAKDRPTFLVGMSLPL